MKNKLVFVLALLCLSLFLWFSACKPPKEVPENPVTFSGSVVTWSDEVDVPVPGAEIRIGNFIATTDQGGNFRLIAEKADRYVVNITKNEYGLTSRIHFLPAASEVYRLHPATTQEFDPTTDIELTDTRSSDRIGSPASRANWQKNPGSQIPLVIDNGKLVDFGFPEEVQKAFDYISSRKNAGAGATVRIQGGTLVDGSGKQPSGKVNVSVSTIDLFSPDAMPGDFTISNDSGKTESGYMVSFGAASVSVWDRENSYSLADQSTAEVRIPVDPSQIMNRDSLPESIVLYYYNEATGYWQNDGKAVLNSDKTAYEGKVSHFSSFNMDIEKTTPACIKVRHNGQVVDLPTFKVEAIAMKGMTVRQTTRTITEPGGCLVKASSGTGLHQLYNLPQSQQMCLIFYDAANVPLSITVPTTNATYKPGPLPPCSEPACPGACVDEALCDSDPACNGYAGCASVQFSIASENLLMAAEKGTVVNTVVVKWVYKNHVSGTTTYSVHETNPGTGCGDDPMAAPLALFPERTINGGYKVMEKVFTVTPGTHYFKVKASDAAESNCFSSNPITWP